MQIRTLQRAHTMKDVWKVTHPRRVGRFGEFEVFVKIAELVLQGVQQTNVQWRKFLFPGVHQLRADGKWVHRLAPLHGFSSISVFSGRGFWQAMKASSSPYAQFSGRRRCLLTGVRSPRWRIWFSVELLGRFYSWSRDIENPIGHKFDSPRTKLSSRSYKFVWLK